MYQACECGAEYGRRPVWRYADQVQITRTSYGARCTHLVFRIPISSIMRPYCSSTSSHPRLAEAMLPDLHDQAALAAGVR